MCFPIYSHVENGHVQCSIDKTTRQEVCAFECEDNFLLTGEPVIHCSERGGDGQMRWNERAPRCVSLFYKEKGQLQTRGAFYDGFTAL